MEIVKEVELRKGGGIGGFQKDESDDLEDQTYAEKLVFSDDFIEAMLGLKVAEKVKENGKVTITGGSIILDNSDILPLRDDGKEIGMNGICHKINQVFVAGKMPFYATSMASTEAKKEVKVKTRGNNIGETYTSVKADKVRVYRISKDWDIDNYAVEGSANLKDTAYHTPTLGMRLRVEKVVTDKELHL